MKNACLTPQALEERRRMEAEEQARRLILLAVSDEDLGLIYEALELLAKKQSSRVKMLRVGRDSRDWIAREATKGGLALSLRERISRVQQLRSRNESTEQHDVSQLPGLYPSSDPIFKVRTFYATSYAGQDHPEHVRAGVHWELVVEHPWQKGNWRVIAQDSIMEPWPEGKPWERVNRDMIEARAASDARWAEIQRKAVERRQKQRLEHAAKKAAARARGGGA